MKHWIVILLLTTTTFQAYSQMYNPVKWEFSSRTVTSNEVELVLKAKIDKGWKLFSQHLTTDMGPVPTAFRFHHTEEFSIIGEVVENGTKIEAYSEVFEMPLTWYEGTVTFTQRIKVNHYGKVHGEIEFMTCNRDRCLPPDNLGFEIDLTVLDHTRLGAADSDGKGR